jgi:hypothetical protein
MFRQCLPWALPCSASLILSGCATLSQGTRQEITVALPDSVDGRCAIRAPNGRQLHEGPSPLRVTIDRGRQTLKAECEANGLGKATADIKSSFTSRARIQAPLGYAVDGLSGAMWTYPAQVTVPVPPRDGGA